MDKMKIYTIGVSKKSAKEFFSILEENNIDKLLDIRINNKSQLLGFSKGQDLKYFCEQCHGIKYEHIPLLAPTDELIKRYRKDNDWPAYERDFLSLLKARPVKDIFNGARGKLKNVCLLCSESSPKHCHRRLVGEYLGTLFNDTTIVHL